MNKPMKQSQENIKVTWSLAGERSTKTKEAP